MRVRMEPCMQGRGKGQFLTNEETRGMGIHCDSNVWILVNCQSTFGLFVAPPFVVSLARRGYRSLRSQVMASEEDMG